MGVLTYAHALREKGGLSSFPFLPLPLHTRQTHHPQKHNPPSNPPNAAEGSLYVMHNEAVTKLDHAVSAPHAAFKVRTHAPVHAPSSVWWMCIIFI